jgi:DNA-binding transcriptional ArsR family regulator
MNSIAWQMPDREAKRLLWYLFAGSRGGENRIRIIELIKEQPHNINQLAEALGIDYKSVQHHIGVLEKNNMVTKVGEKYGVIYFISNYLEANIEAFNGVKAAIDKNANLSRSGKK